MRQKQKESVWQICHSRGVLDNAKGPFFSRKNSGESFADKTIRMALFMIGVMATAQLLNFIQVNYVQSDTIPRIFGQNLVRESISFGYYGNYFGNPMPPNEAKTGEPAADNQIAIRSEQVLSAQTHRSLAAADQAETDFRAELVGKSYVKINIQSGRAITYEVRFKNTGQVAWTRNGQHFIALNVTNPTGRLSPFKHQFWSEYYYRPTRLLENEVKPGEVGTFRFALQAPAAPGEYSENFGLVAENLTWIAGGNFSVTINVIPPPLPYQTELVSQSDEKISLTPGEIKAVWFDFKNTGTAVWSNINDNFVALNVTSPTGRESAFQHASWNEYHYRPTRLDTAEVKPGEIGRISFILQAPLQPGEYSENFGLVAENLTWIAGGAITLPITVARDSVAVSQSEPDIRVGLFNTDKAVRITATDSYKIVDGQGKLIAEMPAQDVSKVIYKNNKYSVTHNEKTVNSVNYIRFEPQAGETVFEILSYENRPAWNQSLNDNSFRGKIEMRYSEATRKLWLINELPLEQYLRGVAEASNSESEDYLKALIIAERTYAQYHLNQGTKHRDENYTVDSTYDQVYRGYGFEVRAPRITEFINETAGTVVTYRNQVVVTPYFSHSDGRTRSWEEVWSGGPYPWLKSVPDPASKGLEILGHGVGLSALGARSMALDGKSFEAILKYFYSGIKLKKIY